jgi:hypothetical protein
MLADTSHFSGSFKPIGGFQPIVLIRDTLKGLE